MLKALMLKRSIDAKRAELAELENKDAEFSTREAELAQAIDEVETPDQETAITEEIDKFDADHKAHTEAKEKLSADIEQLESELEEIERSAPKPQTRADTKIERTETKMQTNINIRSLPMGRRAFDALPIEQRTSITDRKSVV